MADYQGGDDGGYAPFDPTGTGAPAADPWSADDLNAARQFYASYIAQHGLGSWGTADDALRFYQSARQSGAPHDQALQQALTALGWDDASKWPAAATTPAGSSGGNAGADPTLGSLLQPFTEKFQAPPPVDLGGTKGLPYIPDVPTLSLPTRPTIAPFSYADFQLPSGDQIRTLDPGYDFRQREGERALINHMSANGVGRGGPTLKNFLQYNQDYATNEYGNSVNRLYDVYRGNRQNALDTYNTNYRTQVVDPYQFDVSAALAQFAPQMEGWRTLSQAGQRQNELDWEHQKSLFDTDFNIFQWNKQWPYTVLSNEADRGLRAAGM